MAEKTMTQVQALEIAVEALVGEEFTEARTVLANMVEKRKNVSRKPRVNKEAVAFREELIDVMEELGFPVTNAELTVLMNEGRDEDTPEVKPQKVANNIRVLEKDGAVVRIRGEKASDKDTFALAAAE